jgi:hypothetical protein
LAQLGANLGSFGIFFSLSLLLSYSGSPVRTNVRPEAFKPMMLGQKPIEHFCSNNSQLGQKLEQNCEKKIF